MKSQLENFITVHAAEDAGKEWTHEGHGYVPQTYFFFPSGTYMDVTGPNESYAHFFGNDHALSMAMQ